MARSWFVSVGRALARLAGRKEGEPPDRSEKQGPVELIIPDFPAAMDCGTEKEKRRRRGHRFG